MFVPAVAANEFVRDMIYICTIYTYMHHMHPQMPPKYNIYLFGLLSVLYETSGQNEISV